MSAVTIGLAAAEAVAASRDRVDVWRLPLGPGAWEPAEALRLLNDAERERAARMRHGEERWVAARASLRAVLGRCLGVAPQRVSFALDGGGRPRLAPGAPLDLRFSLSHSGDVALLALRHAHDVGVDVEHLRDDVNEAALARDFLGEAARAEIAVLAGTRRREAFFRAWARREALAKAAGRGLDSLPDARDTARFTVRDLDGIRGCAAAVASEGDGWTLARVRAEEPALR